MSGTVSLTYGLIDDPSVAKKKEPAASTHAGYGLFWILAFGPSSSDTQITGCHHARRIVATSNSEPSRSAGLITTGRKKSAALFSEIARGQQRLYQSGQPIWDNGDQAGGCRLQTGGRDKSGQLGVAAPATPCFSSFLRSPPSTSIPFVWLFKTSCMANFKSLLRNIFIYGVVMKSGHESQASVHQSMATDVRADGISARGRGDQYSRGIAH